MPFQHVDPETVSVWRWEGAITAMIAAAGSGIALAAVQPSIALAAAGVIALFGLSVAWFWHLARYRRLTYGVDEFGLVIRQGVIWRSQTSLPRVRIQHSDVSQGPLQRRYGIATLKLYTAGSRYTKIELPGLRHGDALSLRDDLLARSTGNELAPQVSPQPADRVVPDTQD
jgi:membrane protein YdbS with pleckstrin-like domain